MDITQQDQSKRKVRKLSVWYRVVLAVLGVGCLIAVAFWASIASLMGSRLDIQAHANTDCQAVIFHMENPEEAIYRLRNYDDVVLSSENPPDGADAVVSFRQETGFGWVYGHISYKNDSPVSYMVGFASGLIL